MTATTAIAATLLEGGRTVHYKLKLGIHLDERSRLNIEKNSQNYKLLNDERLKMIVFIMMKFRGVSMALKNYKLC